MTPAELQAARRQLKLTQQALGERLGLTGRQVRNLETGKTPIKPSIVLAVRALAGELAARSAP